MPYIEKKEREAVDALLAQLTTVLLDAKPGVLNYCITKLCDGYIKRRSYTDMNEVVGVLECAKLELYRRLLTPYENEKCLDNGDVYEN